MKVNYNKVFIIINSLSIISIVLSCQPKQKNESINTFQKGTFGYDAEFLAKHQETIILQSGNAMVAICPGFQGRVMTSSSMSENGLSYGWINHALIESGEILDKINPVGGEDRFWLGPEGGQFSLFFSSGAEFNLDHWQTPAEIDTETYEVDIKNDHSVVFSRRLEIENYSKVKLNIGVKRQISFIVEAEIPSSILNEDGLNFVAYKSVNEISNNGESPWARSSGAVSIWILGMFNPSPSTTIFIPFKEGNNSELGPIVNDEYFGKVPSDRLIIREGMIYFKGDGRQRGKIGLNPKRALPVLGSFDEKHGVLTIVKYSKPEGVTEYVNSMWELQDDPFAGDAVNSYNDGPVDGKALGPFYELETSSPAAFLEPGESMEHTHQTFHIQGTEEEMDRVVQDIFNARLNSIKEVF